MENKNTQKYIIIIIMLIIMVLGLGGYIVYDKVIDKKEEDNVIKENEKVEDNQEDSVITLEESETFLNELVSTSVSQDLLISNTENEIFFNSIKYLSLNKKYTKDGEYYIFKQDDIKVLARKYYMNENYDYISADSGFIYDATNKTYKSLLNFGLFSPGPSFEKTRVVENFDYKSGVATLTYQVKLVYDAAYLANPDDNTEINNYKIELIKVDEELRIKNISLI